MSFAGVIALIAPLAAMEVAEMGGAQMSFAGVIALIVPLAVIELVMKIIALTDVWKRKDIESEVRWGWTIVIVLVSTIGWLVYFIAGRKRREEEEIL